MIVGATQKTPFRDAKLSLAPERASLSNTDYCLAAGPPFPERFVALLALRVATAFMS